MRYVVYEETDVERFYHTLNALLVVRRCYVLPWAAPKPTDASEADRVLGWQHPEGNGAYIVPLFARSAVHSVIDPILSTDRALGRELAAHGCLVTTEGSDLDGYLIPITRPGGTVLKVWHFTPEAMIGEVDL